MRLDVGDAAPDFTLPSVDGTEVTLSEVDGWRHLRFYRYAGCPSCLLSVRRAAARVDEVEERGIRVLALFHSPVEDLARTADDLPFPVLADPSKEVFGAYGVEQDWTGLLSVRTVKETLAGLLAGNRWRPAMARTGWTGLPADVLVDPDGVVQAIHHGEDFADSWTVDDLLRIADEVGAGTGAGSP